MKVSQQKKSPALIVLIFFVFSFATSLVNAQDGEALYKSNCTACHAINDKVIGPALKDMHKKHDEAWLIKWIKNSQDLVKAGDPVAVKLFEANNKIIMPASSLKDDEIKAVIAYVKTESEKVVAAPAPVAGAAQQAEPKKDNTVWYLLIAILVLIALAWILKGVKDKLESAARLKRGEQEPVQYTGFKKFHFWAHNNKKLIAVGLILFMIWGSVEAWYGMASIGIQQGYTPDQPIAFSHKLHAGELQIQCVYCHSAATKGKTAGIPSADVCMNCHKFVKSGPTTGKDEIAKIYKALDYDPETMSYGPNQQPIQWTRVHNLPDHAYFNHSQHYAVGKLECQTCHGPVQDSMTVASQYSKLTMGWCIDCHRSQPVQMAGNGYYDNYHNFVYTTTKDSAITVEKIGGLECARCHY